MSIYNKIFLCILTAVLAISHCACSNEKSGSVGCWSSLTRSAKNIHVWTFEERGTSHTITIDQYLCHSPYGTLSYTIMDGDTIYWLDSIPGYIDGVYKYFNVFLEKENPIFCSNGYHYFGKSKKDYLRDLFQDSQYGDDIFDIDKLYQRAIDGEPEAWRLMSYICYDAYIQVSKMTGLQMIGIDFDKRLVSALRQEKDGRILLIHGDIDEFMHTSPVHVILIDGIIRQYSLDEYSIMNRDKWSQVFRDQMTDLTRKAEQEIIDKLKNRGWEQVDSIYSAVKD